jgi:hypothetical protein
MEDIVKSFENINLNINMIREKTKKKLSKEEILVNDIKNCLNWALQYAKGPKKLEICTFLDSETDKQRSIFYEFERVDITQSHILIKNNKETGANSQIAYEYYGDVEEIKESLNIKNEEIEEINEDFILLKKTPVYFKPFETKEFKPLYTEHGEFEERTNYSLIITPESFLFMYDDFYISFDLNNKPFENPENVKYLRYITRRLIAHEIIESYNLNK